MKLFKALGLAAIAALAAMAFVGVGTASADTACTSAEYENPCAAENEMEAGDPLVGELKEGKAVLKGPLAVECSESTVEGEVTANGGEEVEGIITAVTFNSCTTCEKATSRAGAEFPVQVNFLSVSGGVQQDEFNVHNPVVDLIGCTIFKVKCTATAKEVKLDMHSSPSQTSVVAKEEPLTLSGGLCGSGGTWTATYKLVEPPLVFVSET